MGDAVLFVCFCLFFILLIQKQQFAIFLSTEQEEKHTKQFGRGPIIFDICSANKSETDL